MYLLTLWGAFTLAFCFFRLIPGGPIEAFLSSLAQQYVYNVQAGNEITQHYRQVFGLEGSLPQQYLHYMGQILINVALAFSHVPYYFVALMLIFFAAYRLALFPASAAYDADVQKAFTLDFFLSVLRHGALPSISIVFIGVCNWLISTRMLIVTTLGEDYLTFADAKGLNPRHILTQYALRNCYLPQVTAFGISLGFIFNGNVLVEQLFNYPGIGNLFVQAIGVLDYDTIQGIVALVIFAVLTANLVIDLLLPALDPRVKYWR